MRTTTQIVAQARSNLWDMAHYIKTRPVLRARALNGFLGALRTVRRLGSPDEIAAVERAHAELVQALHATIRAAEPARGAR